MGPKLFTTGGRRSHRCSYVKMSISKASARGGASPADPNKERLMYMLTCPELRARLFANNFRCFELRQGLHGHLVTVKMNNGQMWEGNFHSCSSEGGNRKTSSEALKKSLRQVTFPSP